MDLFDACITALLIGILMFFIGKEIQITYCHKPLKDGRRFVVIKERSNSGWRQDIAYYILGEKLDKKPEKVWERNR